MNKREIGDKGEAFAAEYYKKLGFNITERNFTCRGGEIDIIAENDEYIVFTEVKTRSDKALAAPHEAVDENKIRRITFAAMKYLELFGTEKRPQFDIFEVLEHDGRIYKFRRIENAFEAYDFTGSYEVF